MSRQTNQMGAMSRQTDGGSMTSMCQMNVGNQRPPPRQLSGPGPMGQLPATSPLELAAAAASSGYAQKFGGNDGVGVMGGYPVSVPNRWPQGMGPPPANLGMLQDTPPGGLMAGLGQGVDLASSSTARTVASAVSSQHMDPIAALAALLAAPKNQPQVEAVGVAAHPGGLQAGFTVGFNNGSGCQSPIISPPNSNFNSSVFSSSLGNNMNPFNTSTLESSLHRAVRQANIGQQMPMSLPMPAGLGHKVSGLGPQVRMGADCMQSNEEDDVERFCVYCGKRRAPDHLFCAFCGRRSSPSS